MEKNNRMSPHGNPVALEKLLVGLWTVIESCNEFLEDWDGTADAGEWGHDYPYAPDACRDVSGLLYNAELAEQLLDGVMKQFPERAAREAAEEAAQKAAVRAAAREAAKAPAPRKVAAENPFYRR